MELFTGVLFALSYYSFGISSGFLIALGIISMLSILYLIKWEKNPNFKNVILFSIFMGFGLMTKTIVLLLFIPAIFTYFKKLNTIISEDKKIVSLVFELLVFCLITFTLGLWYQIYNLLKGNDVFGIIAPFDYLEIKDVSFIKRVLPTTIFHMSAYNLWNHLLFCSYNILSLKTFY